MMYGKFTGGFIIFFCPLIYRCFYNYLECSGNLDIRNVANIIVTNIIAPCCSFVNTCCGVYKTKTAKDNFRCETFSICSGDVCFEQHCLHFVSKSCTNYISFVLGEKFELIENRLFVLTTGKFFNFGKTYFHFLEWCFCKYLFLSHFELVEKCVQPTIKEKRCKCKPQRQSKQCFHVNIVDYNIANC